MRASRSFVLTLFFSALFGAVISLALLLLFALALQKGWLDIGALSGVTAAVKVISAAGAALLAAAPKAPRAWLRGGLAGVSYAALAFLLFALLSRSFAFSWAIASDLGMGFLSGVFTVLLKRALR